MSYEVSTCARCPFAAQSDGEWLPRCNAQKISRGLPAEHAPDGPPPKWCPLPIMVERSAEYIWEMIRKEGEDSTRLAVITATEENALRYVDLLREKDRMMRRECTYQLLRSKHEIVET